MKTGENVLGDMKVWQWCQVFSEATPCRLVRKRGVQWPEILKHDRELVEKCRNYLHIDMGS